MVLNVEKFNSHFHRRTFSRKRSVFRCNFSFWDLKIFGRKINEKSLRFINSAPTKRIYIRITNYKFTQPKILKKVANKITIAIYNTVILVRRNFLFKKVKAFLDLILSQALATDKI